MGWLDRILNVSIKSVTDRLWFKLEERKYRSHSHPKTYDWNWGKGNFNRIALVNLLVSTAKGAKSCYLEIGCAGNALFNSVACLSKVGVDPANGGTLRMTSDDFFATNKNTFDVIFIDGLHHYDQVKRDTVNALAALNEGGWIAFHDFLPRSWKEHHVPRVQPTWTGDCWKVGLELAAAEGVEFKIAEIDQGVGILRKTGGVINIPDLSGILDIAEFNVFVEKFDQFPIVSFDDAASWILEISRKP